MLNQWHSIKTADASADAPSEEFSIKFTYRRIMLRRKEFISVRHAATRSWLRNTNPFRTKTITAIKAKVSMASRLRGVCL